MRVIKIIGYGLVGLVMLPFLAIMKIAEGPEVVFVPKHNLRVEERKGTE